MLVPPRMSSKNLKLLSVFLIKGFSNKYSANNTKLKKNRLKPKKGKYP